jgi:hypothetical protein
MQKVCRISEAKSGIVHVACPIVVDVYDDHSLALRDDGTRPRDQK